MFKNFIALVLFCTICMSVSASELKELPYKNIKEGSKITISDKQAWTDKVKRKDNNYFTRIADELIAKDNSVTIETGCEYLFINKGRLYGYSSDDLKFYEFSYFDNKIYTRELNSDEVSLLFKEFRVILISDFTKTTNVYKFKKVRSEEKIMILNDTRRYFRDYSFTTNNSKFEKYDINNAIGITKKGLIQFSKLRETSQSTPWYVILVR